MAALRLLLGRWRADRWLLLLLAAVVATNAGLVGAVPRLLDVLERDSLRDELANTTPDRRGLSAQVIRSLDLRSPDDTWGRLEDVAGSLTDELDPALRDVLADAVPVVDSLRYQLAGAPNEEREDVLGRFVTVRSQLDLPRLEVVEGTLPDGEVEQLTFTYVPDRGEPADLTATVHEVAISRETATVMDLEVGDQRVSFVDPSGPIASRLVPTPDRTVVIEISAIVDLPPPDDPVWFGDSRQHRPVQFDTNTTTNFFGVALVPPHVASELPGATNGEVAGITWRWRLDEDALLASDAGQVAEGALKAKTLLPLGLDQPEWTTSLDRLITREQLRRATAVEVLGLAVVAVTGVVIALLGAVGIVLATRRRDELALIRGRGTSATQNVLTATVEAGAVTLLGAAIALGVLEAVLPGGGGELLVASVALAAAVVLVGTAWPDVVRPLGALLAERRRGGSRRSPGRPVLEGMIVLLALLAVVALRQRGVTVDGEVDGLVIAAPAAVAIAAAVVAARLVPLLLRVTAPLVVGRRRGLAAVLGVARATRRANGGPVVLLVVLGVGVAAVAIAVHAAIVTGQAAAALERVGADVRVDAPLRGTLAGDWAPPSGDDAVADVAQVAGAVVSETGSQSVDVLLVDADEIAELPGVGSLPSLVWDGVGPAPVVASESFRAAGEPALGDDVVIVVDGQRIVGRVASFDPQVLGFGDEDEVPFVLVERDAVTAATGSEALATTRLVTTDDAPAVAASALDADPEATVLVREEVRRDLAASPLARGVRIGFLVASGAAAGATLLAVVLALAAAAPVRRREAAVLAAVGTSRRAIAATALAEVLPAVAASVLCGLGLAAVIASVLDTRLDLASFTGTSDPTSLGAPPVLDAAVVAVAVLLAAGLAAVLTIGRVDTAALLREGEA